VYTIAPSTSADIGSFKIEVLLTDGSLSSIYAFTITVVNTAPTFSSSLTAQNVTLTNTIAYQLPTFSDPEGNTLTLDTMEKGQSYLPSFVSFDSNSWTYKINPMASNLIGTTTTIEIVLSDSVLKSAFYFTIYVNNSAGSIPNTAPIFASNPED